tara:strand:+ start:170 stop:559 length:390 start_codon:yes stop_codon:yes gene_type:complete
MIIYGIGNDIVEISRFKKILQKNSLFKKRIFSKNEILYCEKKKLKIACYAKKFAAKEAFLKALGTGLIRGLKFKEITVINDNLGKPLIKIVGNSLKIVKKITKRKKINIFISISDEKTHAISTAIITSL